MNLSSVSLNFYFNSKQMNLALILNWKGLKQPILFLMYMPILESGARAVVSFVRIKNDYRFHELEIAHSIASSGNLKETLKDAIKNAFETKKAFLIPGGWIGTPSGHAIYYELIPDPDGKTAYLRIFNTGEGIQEHDKIQMGVKEKVGYAEWKGILKRNY